MTFDSQTNILILTEAGIESGGVVRVRRGNQDKFNSGTKSEESYILFEAIFRGQSWGWSLA